uniref:Uncharacterized protein n=1 Tax=Arundo donax TaxID=35708 RepID=A0A0A9H5U8_ARUDO
MESSGKMDGAALVRACLSSLEGRAAPPSAYGRDADLEMPAAAALSVLDPSPEPAVTAAPPGQDPVPPPPLPSSPLPMQWPSSGARLRPSVPALPSYLAACAPLPILLSLHRVFTGKRSGWSRAGERMK